MTIKENSLDIMKSKLEKYQALDFLNAGIIEHLDKKIIVHKKLFIEYRQEIDDLKAENKELKENMGNYPTDRYDFKCIEENTKLKAEIRELKADNKRLNDDYNNDTKVHNEYADGLLAEIKTLQNKIDGLTSSDDVRKLRICRLKNDKLQAENDRLMSQVGSDSSNSSSTHTHTKETEIDAEMVDMHGNVKTIKCYTKDM